MPTLDDLGGVVRSFLARFLAGDLDAVRPLVTPDLTIAVVPPDGDPVVLVGFDAVNAYARERSSGGAGDVRVEVRDIRASQGEGGLVVVFDADSPLLPGPPSGRLGVWTFREGLIASVRLSGAPAGPDAPLQPSVD